MSASSTLLETINLKKHFRVAGITNRSSKVYAVDGVNLKVRHGETLGLVGESGCGKSTLGRTLLRLYEPTAGKILFGGKDITTIGSKALRKLRRDMQIIFQDPYSSLNPKMNIGEILSEPFTIHKLGSKKEIDTNVSQLLETVGLESESKKRLPHEFSGGQRQRIGIARALALKPKLIVADEPVSALDVSIQSQILNLLSDLRSKLSLSYVFIAHDLAVIEHISDSVAVMYLGKIVEYAKRDDLYTKPTHPYTKALISAIPDPEVGTKEKQILSGDVPSPITPPTGCHFHPRCPIATEKCKTEAPSSLNIGNTDNPHIVSCHHV